MKKIANLNGVHITKWSVNKTTIMNQFMTPMQRQFVMELDDESWRIRRHPKNGHIIEVFVDPAVIDARRKFLCDVIFQL